MVPGQQEVIQLFLFQSSDGETVKSQANNRKMEYTILWTKTRVFFFFWFLGRLIISFIFRSPLGHLKCCESPLHMAIQAATAQSSISSFQFRRFVELRGEEKQRNCWIVFDHSIIVFCWVSIHIDKLKQALCITYTYTYPLLSLCLVFIITEVFVESLCTSLHWQRIVWVYVVRRY